MNDEQGRIAVGVLRKPHGIRGEVSVEPWTDSAERFEELKEVTLVSPDESAARAVVIERTRIHAGRILAKFAGIETPEEIAEFRGWSVEIPEGEARELDEDEYFLHDLAGLELIDADGRSRGTVVEAYEGGGGVLLSVKKSDGAVYDVPFAAGICQSIDLAAKRITVELPEGIDEI